MTMMEYYDKAQQQHMQPAQREAGAPPRSPDPSRPGGGGGGLLNLLVDAQTAPAPGAPYLLASRSMYDEDAVDIDVSSTTTSSSLGDKTAGSQQGGGGVTVLDVTARRGDDDDEHARRKSSGGGGDDGGVAKEDIDFYMAVLGGVDPPPATAQTRAVIRAESEGRRRSREAQELVRTARRREELQSAQGDTDFFLMLLDKS